MSHKKDELKNLANKADVLLLFSAIAALATLMLFGII